ncbi:phytanoyl- dioxygenase [Colletotrichum incanum]|uniref:Phytanoyl-dioxygenase n=1 Tax=Colletotrichum incanum TaxID=1573173 RepID=A0A166M398_COLIC|nr:phytanoyl- dioxygenase [Colletotrichum incanum]OHW92203.1 phytanoyl-dioxygenase [Colletotrichum incanum]
MAPSSPNNDPQDSTPVDKEYYNRKAKPLPEDPIIRRYVEAVLRNGYVIIPNAFTEAEAVETIAEIDRLHGKNPKAGSNFFDGYETNRILSLLGKTRVFDKFCLIPQVHALNNYFLDEDYLFYAMETIVINPGEKNQMLHHDDAVTPPATEVTRHGCDDDWSHLWGSDRVGEEHEAIPAVCPRGSVIYFLGTTWHSGGANRSQRPRYAATIQYCQPYIRPLENLMFGIDPRRVLSGEIPTKIADMMGYRSAMPLIGYVDGLNPRKAAMRLVRWLQAPVDLNPPTFAKEKGDKESHVLSKL